MLEIKQFHVDLNFNMSKTFKDKHPKLRFPETSEKKKKDKDSKHRWLEETPSWHTRLMMNRPQRRADHLWEREMLSKEIDELDYPDNKKKPKVYYW